MSTEQGPKSKRRLRQTSALARQMDSITWETPAIWIPLCSASSILDCFTNTTWKIKCIWDSLTFKTILGTREISFYLLPTWCNRCGTLTMLWYRKVLNMSLVRSMSSSEEMINKTLKSMSIFWLMAFMKKQISGSLSLILKILRAMIETLLRSDLRHGPTVCAEIGPSYSSFSMVRWNRRLNASPVTKNRLPSRFLQIFQCPYLNHHNLCSILLCTDFLTKLNACFKPKRKRRIKLMRKTISI